jgi:site-specific DNA recombinase
VARRTNTNRGDRALIYIRVSALMGRSGDDFHSPEVQLDGTRNLVKREGLREVTVVDDDIDASGQTFKRKGIARIRALVEAGEIDVFVVNTLNRVGRNLAESLMFVRWLREHGVRVASANEKIDDSAEGQFMVAMWLNLAELQGNQIGDSWARIIERRAKLGRTHGATPHGYRRSENGRIEPDPDIGPAVTAAFTAYADGDPMARIAERFRTAIGKPVDRRVVKRMLYNPVYIGRVVVESRIAGALDYPGLHQPLVDEITWQRVQHRLAADASTPARYLAPAHALTGLGVCAECRHLLGVKTNWERDATANTRIHVARLHCDYGRATRNCAGVGTPRCAPIEAAVLAELGSYAKFLRDDRPTRPGGTARAADDPARIARELAKTREAMTRLTGRWARGGIPEHAYEATLDELRAVEAEQQAALVAISEPVEAPSPGVTLGLVDELLGLWPDMLPDERNRALRSVVAGVVVRRGTYWREPDEDRVVRVDFVWPHGFQL